ncbi:MAG: hopanoid biosynthesis protein HpnM [Alphaproteobacteria bacterium]|nr:hopanoid biosynthesis protein HpnM [Alphaproteobacteria bacterium]
MLKNLCLAVTAATYLGFSNPAVILAQDTPSGEIERYYDVLHDAWTRADELGFSGRFELLEPAIRDTFNMPYIAQFTVGRYWKKLTDDQRVVLIDAVTRLSAATYASRFDKYSGEQFKVLSESQTDRGDLLVLTNIIDSKGDPVDINYLMRQNSEDWRIIDIYLKGSISELATRRSEFTSVMKREGFDGLISAINKKVAGLEE